MSRTSSLVGDVGIRMGNVIVLGRSHLWESSGQAEKALGSLHTSVEFALVVDHKHNFPFEYVAISQAAGDARNVFIGLHLFQLAGE